MLRMDNSMAGPASAVGGQISYEELRRRIHDPSLTIVNVLPEVAYEEAHIPGSLSLPLGEVRARAREMLPDRDAEIAVYCGGPT